MSAVPGMKDKENIPAQAGIHLLVVINDHNIGLLIFLKFAFLDS